MKPHEHGGYRIWFETAYVNPDISIANVGKIHRELFLDDAAPAIAAARWQAKMGETAEEFKIRIRADLAAEGVRGSLVTIYEHPSFWQRNISLLRPEVRAVIETSTMGE